MSKLTRRLPQKRGHPEACERPRQPLVKKLALSNVNSGSRHSQEESSVSGGRRSKERGRHRARLHCKSCCREDINSLHERTYLPETFWRTSGQNSLTTLKNVSRTSCCPHRLAVFPSARSAAG